MMSSIKQRIDRDEDEGFTLIELMVVLLIIAILLAIAIPTFLGARNTANARSTQENLRNALTAEQTNWTSNQAFATGLSTLEPSLTWKTSLVAADKGARSVAVVLYSTAVSSTTLTATTPPAAGADVDGVVLYGYGKDNNCYAIFQSNNSSADFTGYAEWASGGSACTAPAAPSSTSATSGAAATSPATDAASVTWYSSF